MKLIHQIILLLVCLSAVIAKPTAQSHLQIDQTDLSWLDSQFLDEIRAGTLNVIRDRSEEEANAYISPIDQRVIHVWWDSPRGVWQYKVVTYYASNEILQQLTQAPSNDVVFIDEPTPLPPIEPNPELSQEEPTLPNEPTVPEEPELTIVPEPTLPEEPTVPEEPVPEPQCDEFDFVSVSPAGDPSPSEESSSSSSSSSKIAKKSLRYYVIAKKLNHEGKEITVCRVVDRVKDYVFIPKVLIGNMIQVDKQQITDVLVSISTDNSPNSDDFTNFNNIARSDGQEHTSQFNYWESSEADLIKSLSTIATTFPVTLGAKTQKWIVDHIIDKKFRWGYYLIDCSDIDFDDNAYFRVHAALLVFGYDESTQRYQLFAWTASKRAVLHPENGDEKAKAEAKRILRLWLLSNVMKLATCPEAPVREMQIWEDNLDFLGSEEFAFSKHSEGSIAEHLNGVSHAARWDSNKEVVAISASALSGWGN